MRLSHTAALLPALLAAAACSTFCPAQAITVAAPSALPLDLRSASIPASSSSLAGMEADTSPVASSSVAGNADAAALPDSPLPSSAVLDDEGQTGKPGLPSNMGNFARKWSPTILANQTAQPFSGHDKVVFAFRNSVSAYTFLSVVVSATYSQGIDSAPHYGQGWAPYGQRIGAAAARNTIQTLAADAVFAPLFHDDPRYYELGPQHKLLNRAVYAATRVVITRGDTGSQRVNVPLLAGYAVAAAANNAYYPDRDRGGKDTATSYFSSLGGAVVGLEINEFLGDVLRITRLQRLRP